MAVCFIFKAANLSMIVISAFIAISCVGLSIQAAQLPLEQLPEVKDFPDPFLLDDGSRVATIAQWQAHRGELMERMLTYEYGHLPPGGNVLALTASRANDQAASEQQVELKVGPDAEISIGLIITAPGGKGPFPPIIKGDLTWGRVKPEIVAEVIRRGYMLVEFDRNQAAPDDAHLPGGVRPLYPQQDWGTLAAWAWAYHRTIDYLLTRPDVDAARITITGHSRGGKATLLAGALDERVALTCPNGSGCGGAGCYRFQQPHSEDIAAVLKNFPHWFQSDFGRFIGKVERLPFDQHTLKAIVAPRALLSTEALGDPWANPQGTQQTYVAAKEVFRSLGAEGKIGIHWREGKHEQNEDDWKALLDFADHVLLGKPAVQPFDRLAYPDLPRGFTWSGTPLR